MSQNGHMSPAAGMSKMVRGAIYIAIGALLLAAAVCVVWVFIPDQGGLIGRAFLTVLLLAAFSGIVLLDANLAESRPDWLVLGSVVAWVLALLVGAFKIWAPRDAEEGFSWIGVRVFQLALVVIILQIALAHQRLYWRAQARYVTAFTQILAWATSVLLAGLVLMLLVFLAMPHLFDYPDWYWRVVVAAAILTSVGTLILPLVNALFAPKRAAQPAAEGEQLPWPMFPDGVTPLPYLPDGGPDFAALSTGRPSPGARMWGAEFQPAAAQANARPGAHAPAGPGAQPHREPSPAATPSDPHRAAQQSQQSSAEAWPARPDLPPHPGQPPIPPA